MDRTAASTATPLVGGSVRRWRGPFARWPRAADATLAALVLVLTTTLADGPGDTLTFRALGEVPPLALLVFVVGSAALYHRRRAPLLVLWIAVAAWAVTLGSGYADLGLVAIIALYSAGRYTAECGPWLPAGLAGALVVLTVDGLTSSTPWGETVFGVVVLFEAWHIGRRLRLRDERAAERERRQVAEAQRIVAEERSRIARELHDVVAHRVSLMTVQAAAARAVAVQDPEAARRAMAAVEDAGRHALDELRHLLGVLRPDGPGEALGPQPGVSELPRLVEQVRAAGLDVALTTSGTGVDVPSPVDLCTYRIVQEALTNALKHAGPDARAEVRVSVDDGGVVIEVVDDGRGVPVSTGASGAVAATTGHGIVGMRERTRMLGGELDAGPRPGGGFRVRATLPTGGEPT